MAQARFPPATIPESRLAERVLHLTGQALML